MNSDTNWDLAFEGCDTVIHLAGLAHSKTITEQEFIDVNTNGTLHLAAEAAKAGVKRFVFLSSINVLDLTSSIDDNAIESPNSLAAKSKLDSEIALKKLSSETGIELVIVRSPLVYGPNARGNFDSLNKLVLGLPFLPFGMASNQRDFISVQNLSDLLVVCANHDKAPGNIFLASENQTVSIKEFTNAIAKCHGKRVFQVPIPISIIRSFSYLAGKGGIFENLFGDLQINTTKLKDILQWTPPYSMEVSMMKLNEQGNNSHDTHI